MSYIFLDESGDLGFDFSKKKTSRFFVITCLFVAEKGPIEKITKTIFSNFSKTEIRNHHGVLHSYKEKPQTRRKLLRYVSEKDISVITIYLNKKKVYTRLQDEKHLLYNYVANILLDRIYKGKLIPATQKVTLIASRRETNKFLNKNFCTYIRNQLSLNHHITIEVLIRSPHQEKSLQIVDCICWAIFRKHEHGDDSYFTIIKKKVVEESSLFP